MSVSGTIAILDSASLACGDIADILSRGRLPREEAPTVADLEGLQRQLLLLSRDATQLACALFSAITLAKTEERIAATGKSL
jgi:hypothetical protein